jgi:hypothetical protein
MRFEHDYSAVADWSQMVLPLFQPLRLWSPRQGKVVVRDAMHCVCTGEEKVAARNAAASKKGDSSSGAFSMKGGFVSVAGGERRLMIAGKIFRAVTN